MESVVVPSLIERTHPEIGNVVLKLIALAKQQGVSLFASLGYN